MTKQGKRRVPGCGSKVCGSFGPVLGAGLACLLAVGMRSALGSEAAPGSQRPAPAQRDSKAGAGPAEDYRVVATATFHPERLWLLTGAWDGSIQLWDLATRARLLNAQVESNCVAFSPDGRLIAVGWDYGACILDVETHRVIKKARLRATTDPDYIPGFRAIAFAEDPRFVAVAELNGEVSVWDTQTNALANAKTINSHFTEPRRGDLTFFIDRVPAKPQWIVGRESGDILLMDTNSWDVCRISNANEPSLGAYAHTRSYDPIRNRVFLEREENAVAVFSVSERDYSEAISLPFKPSAIQPDKNGKYLVVTAWDRSEAIVFRPSGNGFVKLFSLSEIATSAQRGKGAFLCAAFDSKSDYLFLGGADDPVRYPQHPSLLIDLRTRKCLGPLQTYCPDRSKEVKIRVESFASEASEPAKAE
jgi:WD40 repeat protein